MTRYNNGDILVTIIITALFAFFVALLVLETHPFSAVNRAAKRWHRNFERRASSYIDMGVEPDEANRLARSDLAREAKEAVAQLKEVE